MKLSGDEDFYFILLASVMILILAYYFVFSEYLSLSTLWVVLNLSVGYILLMDERIRKKYTAILRGALDMKVWGYAIFLVVLLFSSILPLILLSSGSGGNSGGNPFISNPVFLAVTIPLIPMFAYAETSLFQRYVMKAVLRSHSYKCPSCGAMAIGVERCDVCGFPVNAGEIPGTMRLMAIGASAGTFALAHIILTGSLLASLTFIGGYLMASIYLKEGWLPVARIHAIYDYIIIGIVIGGSVI